MIELLSIDYITEDITHIAVELLAVVISWLTHVNLDEIESKEEEDKEEEVDSEDEGETGEGNGIVVMDVEQGAAGCGRRCS